MPEKQYDVIVVGAGLSGLQAAVSIQDAGLSCIVLEARDRVGGKTWSVPLANGRGTVDIGAAWINDTNQSHVYALTKRFGIELVQQNTNGDCIFQDIDGSTHAFPYGTSPKFSDAHVTDLERIRDIIHDLSVAYGSKASSVENYDQMSLEQFAISKGATKRTVDMLKVWSRVMLGIEAPDLSAQFFIEYAGKAGGLKQLTAAGTQAIAIGLAALLKPNTIRLSTPVSSITDSGSSVTVTTKTGQTFESTKLVLSIPTPLYVDLTISPPLTGTKATATSSTTHGYYSKVILCYDHPWWTQTPATSKSCGLAISYQSPAAVIRDTSVPEDGHYCLTCFVGGAPGIAWSKLPPHERRAQVLSQVSNIYGNREEVYRPVEIFEQEWTREEYSKGAPCPVMGPGVLSRVGRALAEPVGSLFFVGTETSEVWSGYMEGAIRSGLRGAEEVVESLRGQRGVRAKL
ncbi:flavin-containing amine oxidase [Drepanopeziza brunnea f. sp. 'multigermtubi' MB_m1]|uniref:Amine oxidase n=1 Tax=Marssonina brunnea f. sp. multigermtubi (strain MB_m1) TaxID=1072389 RepID=K1WHW0_MARBU|nr:flavin-containing amine oxidase [Drepanopeziza brunnea f. sp. 'multigermtubi' MB_m1]EKD17140.1 flavin-containing amine oxidase [Drepanopeziza brunnea f. sp. 'multigermtubi' MB_m1]